jgi:molybdopterin/thiamine biosynthesis adenylyltransferase
MTALSTIRHDAIFDPQKHKDLCVTIIGAGATGSRLWLSLVELGVTNIDVYDFDVVESHNLANQIYFTSHIGQPKVDALRDYYKLKTGANPPDSMGFYNHKVTKDSFIGQMHVLFLMTDTIESRLEIIDAFIFPTPAHYTTVIETRMASTHGNVAVFDNFTAESWKATLPSADAPEETTACGSSISVGVTASAIASHAVWQFLNAIERTASGAMRKPRCVIHNLYFKPLLVASSQIAPTTIDATEGETAHD